MEKIKGSKVIEILSKTATIAGIIDMYGYDIDPDSDYVVDHVNGFGIPEYVKAKEVVVKDTTTKGQFSHLFR